MEIGGLLESLIEELPGASRAVFMLREVEQMSTAEVSEALGISEENVKVRLHRARGFLRDRLAAHVMGQTGNLFAFLAVRCDRVVRRVFEMLGQAYEPNITVQ